ncbi:MAG: hypothetical protein EOP06_09735, partial [Proteobacteria bacterium]
MPKIVARYIRSLQIAVDAFCITVAWLASYWLRFSVIGSAQSGLEHTFILWFFPLLLLTLYFFLKNEQYDQHLQRSVTDEVMRLFRANALSVVAFIIFLYFFSEGRISRLTIVLYSVVSTFFLIFGRLLVRSLVRKLRRKGLLLRKVFVVGDGPQISRYLEAVEYTPGTGMAVAGLFGVPETIRSSGARYSLEELKLRTKTESPDV